MGRKDERNNREKKRLKRTWKKNKRSKDLMKKIRRKKERVKNEMERKIESMGDRKEGQKQEQRGKERDRLIILLHFIVHRTQTALTCTANDRESERDKGDGKARGTHQRNMERGIEVGNGKGEERKRS